MGYIPYSFTIIAVPDQALERHLHDTLAEGGCNTFADKEGQCAGCSTRVRSNQEEVACPHCARRVRLSQGETYSSWAVSRDVLF